MKLHPRTLPVQGAAASIKGELWRFQDEHDLTDIEMLRVLIEAQQSLTKSMLREERHPGTEGARADEDCGGQCQHEATS